MNGKALKIHVTNVDISMIVMATINDRYGNN